MPTYRVTAPDGTKLRLTGDGPPTDEELDEIFSSRKPKSAMEKLIAIGEALPSPARDIIEMDKGTAKAVGKSVLGLGRMVKGATSVIPGPGLLGELSPEDKIAFDPATYGDWLRSTNWQQSVGENAERVAEFLAIPGPGKLKGAKTALELAGSAAVQMGLAANQGASEGGVWTTGALAAGIPLVGPPVAREVSYYGQKLGEKMVRSALKPTIAMMQKVSGAVSAFGKAEAAGERAGRSAARPYEKLLSAKAEAFVRFIIDKKLTTPEKAEAFINAAKLEGDKILSLKDAPVDAPSRAVAYISALVRRAKKMAMNEPELKSLQKAADELLNGGMSEEVLTFAGTPGARDFRTVVERRMRPNMMASDAMESAKISADWRAPAGTARDTASAYRESNRAIGERAQRASVKAAIPEMREPLMNQHLGIIAKEVLDKEAFKAAQRDPVELKSIILAGGEVASGRLPLMALAASFLRKNQFKLGVHGAALAKALEAGDAGQVAHILGRLGVATPALATAR